MYVVAYETWSWMSRSMRNPDCLYALFVLSSSEIKMAEKQFFMHLLFLFLLCTVANTKTVLSLLLLVYQNERWSFHSPRGCGNFSCSLCVTAAMILELWFVLIRYIILPLQYRHHKQLYSYAQPQVYWCFSRNWSRVKIRPKQDSIIAVFAPFRVY